MYQIFLLGFFFVTMKMLFFCSEWNIWKRLNFFRLLFLIFVWNSCPQTVPNHPHNLRSAVTETRSNHWHWRTGMDGIFSPMLGLRFLFFSSSPTETDRCPPLILMSYYQLQQYVPYLKRKKSLNNATPSSCSLPFIVYLRGTLPLVIRYWGLLLFSMYLRPLLFYFGFQLNPLPRPLFPLLLVTMCSLRLKSEPFSARIIHLYSSSQMWAL